MSDASSKVQLSERSWVPLGVTAALAAATGGGGFATAMWIMSTLYGVKDDVNTAALESSKGIQDVRAEQAELARRFDEFLESSNQNMTRAEFENWVLRLSLENKDGGVVVPPVEK